MGFWKDKLDELVSGVANLGLAPIGLLTDLWSVSRKEDGISGQDLQTAFGQRGYQGIQGLSDIAGATGLKYLYNKTPFLADTIRTTFDEAELLWNHEYQKEQEKNPVVFDILNKGLGTDIDPGEVSMSKALGVAGGTVGGVIGNARQGENPLAEITDIKGKWQQSDYKSPGQMLVDNVLNMAELPLEKQQEIKNSSGYIFATGVTDGVQRWVFDPLVVGGKGAKKYGETRGHFIGVERVYGKAKNKIERKIGRKLMGLDEIENQTRAFDAELGPALKKGENAYIIMDADEARAAGLWDDSADLNLRNAEGVVNDVSPITPRANAILSEAKKRLPSDSPVLQWDQTSDVYHYIDISKNKDVGTAKSRELFDFFLEQQGTEYKGVNKLRWVLNPENPKLPNANDLKLMYKIIDEQWSIYGETVSAGSWKGSEVLRGRWGELAKEVGAPTRSIKGEVGRNPYLGKFYNLSETRAKEIVTELFLRKLDEAYPGSSTFTSRLAAANKKELNPNEQGKVIFFNKDEALGAARADADWRKANTKVEASLGNFDLDNPSVVIELDPTGLPVMIPRWDADGGWLITDVSKIDKANIVKKDVYSPHEFPASANAPMAFWTNKGVKSPRLFEDLTEARKSNEKILAAYEADGGPNTAISENMMANIVMQGEYGSTGLLDQLINHPRIKNAIEVMEGKKSAGIGRASNKPMGADEIYKYFFKGVTGGDKIADMLSKAKGTNAKAEVLLAVMGLKMPRSVRGIPGEVMFELNNIRMEMDLVKSHVNAAKKVSQSNMNSHVDFYNKFEDAAQSNNHVKNYKRLNAANEIEDIDVNTLKEIEAIDEYIESRFPDRNLNRPIEEYWSLHPDEAQRAMTDLELQQKLMAKKEKLLNKELQKAIDISTSEELAGMMRHIPYASVGKKIQYQIRNSSFWQGERFGSFLVKPIKTAVEFAPRAWLNLAESNGHLQIERWILEAKARFGSDLISSAETSKWVNRFLGQSRDVDRLETVLAMTEDIIKRIGTKNGFDEQTMAKVVEEMKKGTYTTNAFLNGRRYGPQRDIDIRGAMQGQSQELIERTASKPGSWTDTISYYDTEMNMYVERVLPVLSTQLANWVPLTNLRSLQREIVLHGNWIKKYGVQGAQQIIDSMGEGFYSIWKPTVLLRGAWPIRVVSDEQFRILARGIGLQNHIMALSKTPMSRNIFWDTQIVSELGKMTKAGAGTGIGAMMAMMVNAPIRLGTQGLIFLSKIAAKVIEINPKKKHLSKLMDQLGTEMEPLVSARAGFSTPTDNVLAQYGSFLTRSEQTLLSKFSKSMKSGEFKSIPKGGEGYSTQWLRALNYQLGGDPFGRVVIKAGVDAFNEAFTLYGNKYSFDDYMAIFQRNAHKQAKRFFNTERGKAYSNRLPWRVGELNWQTDWADDLVEMITQYTMINTSGANKNTARLLNRLADGKLNMNDLSSFPEQYWPSVIHGEEIRHILGGREGFTSNLLRGFLVEGFDGLGRLPTDVLSRNPMMRSLFALEVDRRLKLLIKQGKKDFTASEIQNVGRQAKMGAIEETQKFMYNIAETPRLGTTMLRFLIPFFAAGVEVLNVWGGLVRRDPSIVAKANMIWKSPNRAINTEGGMFAGAAGGYTLVTKDDEGNEYITLMLSEQFTQDKEWFNTYWGKYLADSTFRFNKNSFNMMLNNPIGNGGPIVNLAANEFYIRNPEQEKTAIAEFLLSWGAKGGTSFTERALAAQSPTVRGIAEGFDFVGDYNGQKLRLLNDVATYFDVQVRLGEIDLVTPKDIFDATDKLWWLYAYTRYYSPASPILDSPLKPYKDALQEYIEEYGNTEGVEKFIQNYGDEYFAVTKGRTVSRTGIPPTVEAELARKQFQDVILKYPEYGNLIIGDLGDVGEFSSTVFAAQLSSTVDRQFGEQVTERFGVERDYRDYKADDFLPDGRIKEVDADIGWQKYGRLMDEIDAVRMELGLPNLLVKDAEKLKAYKDEQVSKLKEEHPAWADDYDTPPNVNNWNNKMQSLEEIALAVLDPSVTNDITTRPDMVGLILYIGLRKDMQKTLSQQKYKTLNAKANTKLKYAWDTEVLKIVDQYPEFANIYYRYLEGDPVK